MIFGQVCDLVDSLDRPVTQIVRFVVTEGNRDLHVFPETLHEQLKISKPGWIFSFDTQEGLDLLFSEMVHTESNVAMAGLRQNRDAD